MRPLAVSTYPWAAPLLIGAAFFAAAETARLAPGAAPAAVPALGAFASFAAAFAAFGLARMAHRPRIALLTAATPGVLVAAAFACFLIIDSSAGRIALAATAVVLSAAYLAYLRGIVRHDERFRDEDFSHLSFAVHVISVFFAFAFAFAVPNYLQTPMPAITAAVSVVILLATAESIRRAGLGGRDAALLSAAFVAFGAQLYLALSFLPTTNLVNAAVGTVLYASGLHAAVTVLSGRSSRPAFRRQFALSFVMLAVVFATARWA
ncbi:MAG TPA: hypothetical protein VL426_01635 [Candidatus Binatia bacterium]|jgi:hypothetical protein|nr:hypothetical protein [Candidatus Binatia bacterium]